MSTATVGCSSPAGATARIRIGDDIYLDSVSAVGQSLADIKTTRAAFEARLRVALTQAGYPAAAPGASTATTAWAPACGSSA